MKHRFPIGTQYWSRGKHPRLCTVVAQLTTKDEAGRVISIRYTTHNEFLGQKIDNHDVVDPTIAMGLLPEYRHLLTAAPEPTGAEPEHTVTLAAGSTSARTATRTATPFSKTTGAGGCRCP